MQGLNLEVTQSQVCPHGLSFRSYGLIIRSYGINLSLDGLVFFPQDSSDNLFERQR